MPTDIEQLVALQTVDARARRARLELEELTRAVAETRRQVEEKRRGVEAARAEVERLQTRQRELEASLQDEEARIRERRMHMQRVRNDKELSAMRREVELRREAIGGIEEEALQILETLDAKSPELERLAAALEQGEGQLAEASRSLSERRTALEEELAAGARERQSLAAAVDSGLLARYERLFEARAGVAVVTIDGGICSGCGLQIPPQLITQAYRKIDLVCCPSCQRLIVPPSLARPSGSDGAAEPKRGAAEPAADGGEPPPAPAGAAGPAEGGE